MDGNNLAKRCLEKNGCGNLLLCVVSAVILFHKAIVFFLFFFFLLILFFFFLVFFFFFFFLVFFFFLLLLFFILLLLLLLSMPACTRLLCWGANLCTAPTPGDTLHGVGGASARGGELQNLPRKEGASTPPPPGSGPNKQGGRAGGSGERSLPGVGTNPEKCAVARHF